jgi:SPP1 gp7 family putative phage head morphogenesis protein
MSSIYTEEEVFNLAALIHSGAVDLENLPLDNYNAVGFSIWNEVQKAFGVSLDDVDKNSTKYKKLVSYKQNVFNFSAAKTFQMVKDGQKLLYDVNGIKKEIDVFKPQFKAVEGAYNKTWLQAELNLAQRQGTAARLWDDIQEDADLFPLLRYQTVGDQKVRDEHRALDEVVRPVNDAFWKNFYPPNGWNCRCTVEQLPEDEAEITPIGEAKKVELNAEFEHIPPLFNYNPGIELKIFRGSHPYFSVGNKYQYLKRSNFGLRIPEVNNVTIKDAKALEF